MIRQVSEWLHAFFLQLTSYETFNYSKQKCIKLSLSYLLIQIDFKQALFVLLMHVM